MISSVLILLLSPSGVQDLAQQVTFESRAARIENLMPELAKAAKERLMFSASVKDEVLVISVRDVPLKTLMDKMAHTACAEWVKEEQGYRLIRSPKLQRELEEASRARLAAGLAKAQDELRERLKRTGEYTDTLLRSVSSQLQRHVESGSPSGEVGRQQRLSFNPLLPGYRLLMRIASALDVNAIAAAPDGTQVVFSTQPNRLQSPLANEAMRAIETYQTEVDRLKPYLPTPVPTPRTGIDSQVQRTLKLRDRSTSVAKVLAIASSASEFRSSQIQVFLAGPGGEILDQSELSLTITPTVGPEAPKRFAELPAEPTIPLSPMAKELALHVARVYPAQGRRSEPMPALSSELRTFLLHPEKNESTALVFSEVLLAAAKSKEFQVVVTPAFGAIGPGGGLDVRPSVFLNRYLSSPFSGFDVTLENGWLVSRPLDWSQMRSSQPNRAALGAFLRRLDKSPIGLDDLAEIALKHLSRAGMVRALEAAELLFHDKIDRNPASQYSLLRLHGSLSREQRSAAMDAGVSISVLSPDQLNRLENIVYGNNDLRMAWDYQGRSNEPEGVHSSIRFQPTECYSGGLPKNTILKMKLDDRTVVQAMRTTPEGYFTGMEFDEDMLANALMQKERPEIRDFGEPVNWTSFTPIERSSVQYTLHTLPQLFHYGVLQYVRNRPGTVDSIERLPRELLDRVQAKLVQLRQRYKDYRPPG